VQIGDLSLKELQELNPKFEADVKDVFDFESSVEKRAAVGGTSMEMIRRQVDVLRGLLTAAKQT
jgi:argininosuccinate lyase